MDNHQYHHHHDDQYQHHMTITSNDSYNNTIITTPLPTTMDSTKMMMDEEKKMMMTSKPQEPRNCPRCNSNNTKFCYYNNYSLAQPRYLCKSCRRYWTEGGSLRNVPVGGGSRKNKKLPLLNPNSSTSSTNNLPDLNPPFVYASSSSNPSKIHQNNNDLSLSFSAPTKQDKRDQNFSEQVVAGGQNYLFAGHMGMIQFREEYGHHDNNNNKTNHGFSLDKNEKEIGNHDNFVVNGGKMTFPYGNHDDDDGSKKREGGSSNDQWSGMIIGGGPTW